MKHEEESFGRVTSAISSLPRRKDIQRRKQDFFSLDIFIKNEDIMPKATKPILGQRGGIADTLQHAKQRSRKIESLLTSLSHYIYSTMEVTYLETT